MKMEHLSTISTPRRRTSGDPFAPALPPDLPHFASVSLNFREKISVKPTNFYCLMFAKSKNCDLLRDFCTPHLNTNKLHVVMTVALPQRALTLPCSDPWLCGTL